MMHGLWTENDLSAATDDIGCTERSLSDWIPTINSRHSLYANLPAPFHRVSGGLPGHDDDIG